MEVLPHFYEMQLHLAFTLRRLLARFMVPYQLQLRSLITFRWYWMSEFAWRVRSVYHAVLSGFVGISSQLPTLAWCDRVNDGNVEQHLSCSKMVTWPYGSQRSFMDLRLPAGRFGPLCRQTAAATVMDGKRHPVDVQVGGDAASFRTMWNNLCGRPRGGD